jgi:hypothetical protein
VTDIYREIAQRAVREKINEQVERKVAEADPAVAEGIERATGAMERFFIGRIGQAETQSAH